MHDHDRENCGFHEIQLSRILAMAFQLQWQSHSYFLNHVGDAFSTRKAWAIKTDIEFFEEKKAIISQLDFLNLIMRAQQSERSWLPVALFAYIIVDFLSFNTYSGRETILVATLWRIEIIKLVQMEGYLPNQKPKIWNPDP